MGAYGAARPGPSRVQGVGPRHAKASFTLYDKPLLPVLQRGLDDPRITVGSVIAAAHDQAHAVAVALKRSR